MYMFSILYWKILGSSLPHKQVVTGELWVVGRAVPFWLIPTRLHRHIMHLPIKHAYFSWLLDTFLRSNTILEWKVNCSKYPIFLNFCGKGGIYSVFFPFGPKIFGHFLGAIDNYISSAPTGLVPKLRSPTPFFGWTDEGPNKNIGRAI